MPKSIILLAAVLLTLALLTGVLTLLRSASQGNSSDPMAEQLRHQAQALRNVAAVLQQPPSADSLSSISLKE